jgi:hypothetical protein
MPTDRRMQRVFFDWRAMPGKLQLPRDITRN